MLGFSLPLILFLAILLFLGCLLSLPIEAAYPVAKFLEQAEGTTGVGVATTVVVSQLVFFFSQAYDIYYLQTREQQLLESGAWVSSAPQELYRAVLNTVLTGTNMILFLMLLRFARVIRNHRKLSLSHQALQRQAEQLSKYSLESEVKPPAKPSAPAASDAKSAQLAKEVAKLRQQKEDAQQALDDEKSRYKAMEKEFDRLAEECQRLQKLQKIQGGGEEARSARVTKKGD